MKVAADAPLLPFSVLHFLGSDNSRRAPTYQAIVRNFANLQHPIVYTVNKDRKQKEHNYSTLIRARARNALPRPLEFRPVWWLHIPLNRETDAVDGFPDLEVTVILRNLTAVIQQRGSRVRG